MINPVMQAEKNNLNFAEEKGEATQKMAAEKAVAENKINDILSKVRPSSILSFSLFPLPLWLLGLEGMALKSMGVWFCQ